MGTDIDRVEFTDDDFIQFKKKLADQLLLLKKLIDQPTFGTGPSSIGAELELYIVDRYGHALAQNEAILEMANDERLTPELNTYNIEYNFQPCLISEHTFSTLEKSISHALS